MKPSDFDYYKIKTLMAKKNYRFYTDPLDMNIIGIRMSNPIVNTFCDYFAWCYTDEQGHPQCEVFSGTTDPGSYWLENPMVAEGCGIMVPGQYHSLWTKGLHHEYDALVQYGPVKLYRDNNKDDTLDMDPSTIQEGQFGVDMHHAANQVAPTALVGMYSAACQVYAVLADFVRAMTLRDMQINAGLGQLFSYTLLLESEFV